MIYGAGDQRCPRDGGVGVFELVQGRAPSVYLNPGNHFTTATK